MTCKSIIRTYTILKHIEHPLYVDSHDIKHNFLLHQSLRYMMYTKDYKGIAPVA